MATRNTLKKKIEQVVSSNKISKDMKEFVERIDHLRASVSGTNASFSRTLLALRKGR